MVQKRINPKVGKWEIVVEEDGMLPDDYIMLKYNDYPKFIIIYHSLII